MKEEYLFQELAIIKLGGQQINKLDLKEMFKIPKGLYDIFYSLLSKFLFLQRSNQVMCTRKTLNFYHGP